MKNTIAICLSLISWSSFGQSSWKDTTKFTLPELKKTFNKSGSHYIKATFLAQTWARYSDLNPGSTIDGYAVGPSRGDIGICRLRVQAFGQLTDRIFFYTQFGQNNLNGLTPRFSAPFLHDVVTEYKVNPYLQIGGGFTSWSGMSRYSAPAVSSILSIDVPIYQQATNNVNDQFGRKFSLYMKGEISHLQYRVAISDPLSIKTSASLQVLGVSSSFNPEPPKLQTSGYLIWQFFEKESITTPYMNGTYYGKKKVLNIGAGWVQQNKAMWRLNTPTDTVRTHMLLLGIDAFTELPIGKKGSAFTGYAAFNNFDFGKNYLRMAGAMNPTNGTNSQASLNGTGVLFPMIGTGNTLFGQFGYKFKDNLLGDQGTLQVYMSSQYSQFQALKDPSVILEGGINWLIHGNSLGKLTFGLQNRPIFVAEPNGDNTSSLRKNMYVLQYQISL